MTTLTQNLGPVIGATLLTNNLTKTIDTYCNELGFALISSGNVTTETANYWHSPNLAGAKTATLKAANDDEWLTVVAHPEVTPVQPLRHHGWMSLEVNVGDVDKLRQDLPENSGFHIISEPAYLAMSDKIKAFQAAGPCGEVWYFTEIQAPVPPFELPMTTATIGSLFIPVLSTPSRDESLSFYQKLNGNSGLCFDTKITVLNKTFGHPINNTYPVATIQLNGNCLFEIDEVIEASKKPESMPCGLLPGGISMISVAVDNIDSILALLPQESVISTMQHRLLIKGPTGELLELVEK